MANQAQDLMNILFGQLARLDSLDLDSGDPDYKKIDRELSRAEAVTSVSSQIVALNALSLRAIQVKNQAGAVQNTFFEASQQKPLIKGGKGNG